MRTIAARSAAVLAGCMAFVACSSFGSPGDDPGTNGTDGGTDGATPNGDVTVDANTDGGSAVLVATSAQAVPWITYDATRVIWSTGVTQSGLGAETGVVSACPKHGCTGAPLVIAPNVPTGSLGTTGTTAFIGYSKFDKPPDRIEPNGAVTSLQSVTARSGLYNFATHAGALFYMTYGTFTSADGGPATFIRQVYHLASSGSETIIGAYSGTGINTASFAVAGDRVFIGAHNVGRIVTCLRAACTFETYGSGDNYYVGSLATDGTRLFWVTLASPSTTALMSCAAGAACAEPTTVLTLPHDSRILAVEYYDGKLYYQTAAGDLVECDVNDCKGKSRVLAHENAFYVQQLAARNLVVDDVNVYYVAVDGSPDAGNASYRVMRVQR